MTFIPSLDEIVLFEVPNGSYAHRLLGELASLRMAWINQGDAACVVGVIMLPEADDLACLLRSVQAWVERSGLGAIRFELDGRTYVLEATQLVPALL